MKKNLRAKILGLGSAFPDQVITNKDLEKIVETTDEWIRERSGIQERRRLREGEHNSDLATRAAIKAIQSAGIDAKEIDLILCCTNTPDKLLPAMGCLVQQKLGISEGNCGAFDISAACAGWVVGMSVADQYVRSGMYKKILVIGAEAITRFVNWEDRGTCVLFGDAAGACIIGPTEDESKSLIYGTHIHSDGRYADILEMTAGGSSIPVTPEIAAKKLNTLQMKGTEVFKHAVRALADVAIEELNAHNLKISDIDWFIPHQANYRIIEAVAKRLEFPMEKVLLNVHKYGNTSAATIPTAFDEFVDKGTIKRGHNILMVTFGGGLTWASAAVKY